MAFTESLLSKKAVPFQQKRAFIQKGSSLSLQVYIPKAWFPYGRNGRKNRVTIFLYGQFI